MSKRRRNPYSNSYACTRSPHKVRYQKVAFAWEVGTRQMKKTGTPLFLYRCDGCKGGWHLTRRGGRNTTTITTAANAATGDAMKHESPAVKPELIFDPDTGLYDVLMEGCVTHDRLDVIGEREKIRIKAKAVHGSIESAEPNGSATKEGT